MALVQNIANVRRDMVSASENPKQRNGKASNAGYDPYEKKLLGVTAMQKQLGKKRFEQLLSGLVVKPQGKPVLAPEDDRRPEFNTAINDFEEENENE